MRVTRFFKRTRQRVVAWFPERHLYVRSGGEMRGYVLTTRRQLTIASGVAAASLWMGISTAAMLVNVMALSAGDQELARTQAKYERWIADRQARLNSAVAQLSATDGSVDELADSIESRHAALALLLTDFKGAPGATQALAPTKPRLLASTPVQRVQAIRMDQERLIAAAETYAKSRSERLRLAFRLAGLNPDRYADRGSALGGPLIEAKDPRALAAVLDVDEDFAMRIQHASTNMSDMRSLSEAARKLPLARPTDTAKSSGFGVRFDPFTRRPAYHSGLDFAGRVMTPIHATAPGVVSFTGVRSGYGNTIEIDHGGGFKTRYAHLNAISVRPGQRIAVGQRIGGMGSTGRSTGPHLHYEVWVNGRAQNPDRFVRAGEAVRAAS
jgi:murein DD-endopeptidase MepM/ murein hydrolase activator NlpD